MGIGKALQLSPMDAEGWSSMSERCSGAAVTLVQGTEAASVRSE